MKFVIYEQQELAGRAFKAIQATFDAKALALFTFALLVGWSTSGMAGTTASREPPPVAAGISPSVIAITSPQTQPGFQFDQPEGRVESAAEGAAEATRAVLNTPDLPWPLDGWEPHEAGGILEFVASPFVAGYAAMTSSHRRLSSDQLAETESDLVHAMRQMADQEYLRKFVIESAKAEDRWQVIPLSAAASLGNGTGPLSAVLETRVETLRLKRLAKSDSSFVLRIRARARLLQPSDGVVLCDRTYQYQSEKAMFIDWARWGGLTSVAETGYRSLADQIARELVPLRSGPPLFLGAGYRKAPGPAPELTAAVRIQRASFFTVDTGAIEIYPGHGPRELFIQRPLTRAQAVEEAVDQNGWEADGLQDDRNSVVQGLTCLAAVPGGIWKQAVALVRGVPERKLQKERETLEAIASQGRPTRILAREVAQDLGSETSEPVLLAAEPPSEDEPSALPQIENCSNDRPEPNDRELQPAVLRATTALPPTALEIQVLSAELSGKEGINPPMALRLKAKAILRSTRDSRELYDCLVVYQSKARRFKAWTQGGGRFFRREIDCGFSEMGEALARQLVSERLVAPALPPRSTIAKN